MDIQIVQWFQSMGSGFMDVVFGIFYYLLNPLVSMIFPIAIYYLFNKKLAYRVGVFYGVTSFFCGTLKEQFNRQRPYDAYDNVSARIDKKASGSSMPSGHAMGSIGFAYPLAKHFGYRGTGLKKRIWVFIVAAIAVMMVGFSRVYMAGHYLTDILAGWGFGIVIVLALDFAMHKLGDKFYLYGLLLIPVMIILICIWPESDSCAVGLAFSGAILIGGYLDHKFVKLDIDIAFWKRALRLFIAISGAYVLGLLVVSKIYESALGFPLTDLKALMPGKLVAEGITDQAEITKRMKAVGTTSYFLMFFVANAWAFIICPFLFKYVPRLWNRNKAAAPADSEN